MMAVFVVDNAGDAGPGSLRAAVTSANNTAGPDTINFSALFTTPQTISLASGQIEITDAVQINGPGQNLLTIQANSGPVGFGNGARAFDIDNGNASLIPVTISGVTLTGGDVSGNGGAIQNVENFTLTGSTVTGNRSQADGGGLFNNGGVMTIQESTIENNNAAFGGGVRNFQGTLNLVDSTVSGNAATGDGGGVDNYGVANITGSTITDNNARFGGGVYNYTQAHITNSTLSGNTASISGGGLYNYGDANINNSTLHNNTAADASNAVYAFAPVDLDNTIVTGGVLGQLLGDFNLFNTNVSITGSNNLTNTNPQLGPLQDNGGPTPTHALGANSPAIDAGNPAFNPNAFTPALTTDQRGADFARVTDSGGGLRVDIGAFEAPGAGPAFPTGDYNRDTAVSAADFSVWRGTVGATVPNGTGADGNQNGAVDPGDAALWRENFGGGSPALAAVAPNLLDEAFAFLSPPPTVDDDSTPQEEAVAPAAIDDLLLTLATSTLENDPPLISDSSTLKKDEAEPNDEAATLAVDL